jgi:hypothetical protein
MYTAQAEVIESFNPGGKGWGAAQGDWTKRGARIRSSRTGEEAWGGSGESLELQFDVQDKRHEAGYWLSLPGGRRDLSSLGQLAFRVRGAKGGEQLRVGLKDRLGFETKLSASAYLEGGLNTGWQEVVIPLEDFRDVKDWYAVDNLSFTFHYDYGIPRAGKVFLDDLRLEGTRTGVVRLERAVKAPPPLSEMDDDQFLDLIQRRAAMYFWNEANPENGLVKDRANAFYPDNHRMASIAAVGFALPVLCVAERRGWLDRDDVYERILNTLRFFRDDAESEHGFYYHFLDIRTGERWGGCELSSIDTGLLMAGVLFAGQYFKGTEIETIARLLYEKVDWKWMLNGGRTLSMGWTPEHGFIEHRWATYDEQSVMDIMAIGAPRYPVSPDLWHAINRPRVEYGPYTFIGVTPLFTHQYSHMFIDFRNIRDRHMDYFENSVQATLCHRQWAIDNMHRSKSYGPDSWGLTACDGPDGYKAYGAPHGPNDGTVAPTAAGGSFPFAPKRCLWVFKFLYQNHADRLWGRYGFADAFNWDRDWVSDVHIGIDQGPIVLMIENHRSEMIWKHFMRIPYIRKGLKLAGFRSTEVLVDAIDLSGVWRFHTGDDPGWADTALEGTGEWNAVFVPGQWEKQGVDDYDGFAWYRYSFDVEAAAQKSWENTRILLEIGGIDDADEVYLNGQQIGASGGFPPVFRTAYDLPRQYSIPTDGLRYGAPNLLAVRVYDDNGAGGIWRGPVRIRVLRKR